MRALLLQAFYSIRSERQLVERIDTDLLFRWFVGLGIEDAVWDATSFTKNRDRLLDGAVASQCIGFHERVRVEEGLDAFARGHLAFGVLLFDRTFGPGVNGLVGTAPKLRELAGARLQIRFWLVRGCGRHAP